MTKLFANVTPWAPISELTFCITFIDSTVWSSVSITSTFGASGETAARPTAGWSDRPASASAAVTAAVANYQTEKAPP